MESVNAFSGDTLIVVDDDRETEETETVPAFGAAAAGSDMVAVTGSEMVGATSSETAATASSEMAVAASAGMSEEAAVASSTVLPTMDHIFRTHNLPPIRVHGETEQGDLGEDVDFRWPRMGWKVLWNLRRDGFARLYEGHWRSTKARAAADALYVLLEYPEDTNVQIVQSRLVASGIVM